MKFLTESDSEEKAKMSRVGAEAEDGSRRRLPSWMADVRKTDNGDAGSSKEISDANSNPVVKCETKRRKSTRQGEAAAEIVTVMKKKKKKRYDGVGRKKKLKPKNDEIQDDDEDEDGDMTLTVEDLLTIAKEVICSELQSFLCLNFRIKFYTRE